MQIQINCDKNIALHTRLSNFVETELHRALDRFDTHLTRIEVHLSDETASNTGPQEKRCKLEVRPRDHQSLIVTGTAADLQQSISGATEKMKRLLDATFGRIAAKRFSAVPPTY